MAHLSCVLADAYIHELGENESAGTASPTLNFELSTLNFKNIES
jgi:hypothetical protein